ncbi:MAG: hypothetical protein HGA85_07090 [Nanoarchaeota archaeon]|nr:hypothetical protein [Nanoarchaeota archaeon]
MKIAICGSMQFTDKMLETQKALENMGHTAFVSDFSGHYTGKTASQREDLKLHHKFEKDAIREYWEVIKTCDAILVLNYDKHGINNYIGGNTLMELGFAHVLHKKVFLLNPVPEIPYYKSEIIATKPVIINGDLSKISD